MKKEILFAVSIGLIIGLIITFGMYRARQAVTGSTTVNIDPQSATKSPSTNTKDAILISEPLDESLIPEAQTRVSGQAFPLAAIVVLTSKGETVGQADSRGNFSLTVPLEIGANIITIRAYGETQEPVEVIRTVVVSTADLTASSSATPRPTTTPKASATPAPTKKPTSTP